MDNNLTPNILHYYTKIKRDNINYCDELYIELYRDKYRNDLLCKSVTNKSFLLYNYETQLWDEKEHNYIKHHFSQNITKLLVLLENFYKVEFLRLCHIDTNKYIEYISKKLKNVIEYIKIIKSFSVAWSHRILLSTIHIFYNEDILLKMNNSKELLPVKNGVINLKTGEFRKREKKDYFSFELTVKWGGLNYNIDLINNFIGSIMLNNHEMVKKLQKILGYGVTGYTHEQKYFMFLGDDGCGKGKLHELLKILMGNYCKGITSEMVFNMANHTVINPSPEIMQLMDTRLGFMDGISNKINEEVIKNVINGRPIVARNLYESPTSFNPLFKLFLFTYDKPKFTEDCLMDKILVTIPFLAKLKDEHTYNPNDKTHILWNNDFEIELMDKLDQLLVWLVIGSVRYFNEGLGDM